MTNRRTGSTGFRLALAAGGVVALASVGVQMGLGRGAAGQPSSQSGSGAGVVETGTARVLTFEVTTTATGDLQAARQIEIRNPLDQQTTITEVVKEGVQVKAGDVIVRLNSQQMEQQIASEQLAVESARANLAVAVNALAIQESENDSAMRKALLDLEVARLEFRQWLEGTVKSRKQALDLAMEKAERELARLQEKFERARMLNAEGFLSTDEMKRDELAYLEADANLKTAVLNKSVYLDIEYAKDEKVKKSAVEEADANQQRTASLNTSRLESRRAELNNSRESLKLREANLAKYRMQVESATIKAPQDGLVVYASSLERDRWGNQGQAIDVGQQVHPNQMILALPDVTEMVAAVRVHESLAGRIKPGMPATVRVDAIAGRTVPGKVLSVGVIAEGGGWRDPNLREYTVRVRLEFPEASSVLKPSMRCEAEITLDRVADALAVPVQAVFSEGLVRYVLVPQGDKFARKPVKVGRRSDRYIEVQAGVAEGQVVLLRAPRTGEVVNTPWSDSELAAVGLKRLPDGRVMPEGGGGGPAGGPPAGGGGARGPAGTRSPGGPDSRTEGSGGPVVPAPAAPPQSR